MSLQLTRFFDLILASLGLIALAPLIFGLAIIGVFDSGSPFFKQRRLGINQKPFILIKFRTMDKDTISIATHLVSSDSIRPFGRFLRRTKLDELPQLWNVLRGDMSLVGPRPNLPNQLELINAREMLGVFSVRPGITGLAQINNIDMSEPSLLAETDLRMIETMSIRNYLRYIILTFLGKGQGDQTK